MTGLDIRNWLEAHSSKVERVGAELVFTHGYKSTSILLPRDEWKEGVLPMRAEPLASFYDEYFGASIDNSQLIFATNIEGGVYVSHKFTIPDFNQMAAQALDLGLQFRESECVFLAEAGWMFIYTLSEEDGRVVLRRYDRDFGNVQVVERLHDVFENWWKIAFEDI
jgi:hypothetical protein